MSQHQTTFEMQLRNASNQNQSGQSLGWKSQGVIAFVLISFCGCGGSADPNASVPVSDLGSGTGTAAASESVDAGAKTPEESVKVQHGRGELWVDENGQKWFGNVPLDAFFDQPYTVASDTTSLGGTASTVVASNASTLESSDPATPESTPDADNPTAAGDSWADLISATVLDDEVKTIRNFLNENLQSVGVFNSSMLMIPPKAATLGALAGVATEHSGSISWQEDAAYIRNLAKQMNSDTLRSGPKDQKRLLQLYEAVTDTLNRSRPADIEALPESDGFAEVSEMRLLMYRLDEAEKRMKTEAGTDSAMNSKKDMVGHEASMMATLTKIVTLPGYGYEDDPEFKGYAGEVISAALSIKEAAQNNDFATYELALTKIHTTCQNCHSKYKND